MNAPRSSPASDSSYGRDDVQRRHIVGSLLFGIGWAVADACPAPIAAQIGQGVAVGGLHADRRGLRRLAVPGAEARPRPSRRPTRPAQRAGSS